MLHKQTLQAQTSLLWWKGRARSFVYAASGIAAFFRREQNARIHGVASILVLLLSYRMGVTRAEALALLFSIALVWITEMINSCIERVMDFVCMRQDPRIKIIKDIAAGAVLIAALAAVATGALVFIPKLMAQ